MKIDWSEFDKRMSCGIPLVTNENFDSVKARILQELETYSANPEIKSQFVKVKTRLRHIEQKALRKLGVSTTEPRYEGCICFLCGEFQSDVEFIIGLNESMHICSACIGLVNELVEDGQQ